MTENILLISLLFLPFLGAFSLIFLKEKFLGLFSAGIGIAEFVLALILGIGTLLGGGYFCGIAGVLGFGLNFTMDGFRAVYLIILSFMWMTALIFSPEYMKGHGNQRRYYLFTLLTLGATAGVFLSADLMSMFLFFEVMSFTSYVWVAQEETKGALRAAQTYLAVAVVGGMVMLMGLFLLSHLTGTLVMAELRTACAAVKERGTLFVAGCLMLFGFGAKAGMFPLHIWLPKAHPVAPAPASALLSGVLTKAGIFGVILLSGSILCGEENFGFLVLFLGVITMFLGAILGVFSIDLKRTFACSSVSQIGFILTGLGAMNLTHERMFAINGTFLHMVNHSLIKLVLFLLAGIVYKNLHTLDFNKIKGFGKGKPFFLITYGAGALAIGGMPLFSGYISKTLLHEAIVEAGHAYSGSLHLWITAAEWIFLISGGMTVAYMLKVFFVLFLEEPSEAVKHHGILPYVSRPVQVLLGIPAVLFAILGMFPNVLMRPLAKCAEPFFTGGMAEEEGELVQYFSFTNLKGAMISLAIGIFVYFVIVRKWMRTREDARYLNRIPVWLDLEDGIYRPLFCRVLPFLFGVPCRILDRLISEKFFAQILPFLLAIPCRFFDKFIEGVVWVLHCTVFAEVQDKERERGANRFAYLIGRAFDGVSEFFRRITKRGKRKEQSYAQRFDAGQEKISRTVRLVTRSVSYGLLLSCIGLLATMLYLLLSL